MTTVHIEGVRLVSNIVDLEAEMMDTAFRVSREELS